ncbi:hypothetical protein LEMLEM_LOCUS9416 [Lemmus lemmus]
MCWTVLQSSPFPQPHPLTRANNRCWGRGRTGTLFASCTCNCSAYSSLFSARSFWARMAFFRVSLSRSPFCFSSLSCSIMASTSALCWFPRCSKFWEETGRKRWKRQQGGMAVEKREGEMQELRPTGTDTRAVAPLGPFDHGEHLESSDTQVTQQSAHPGSLESM